MHSVPCAQCITCIIITAQHIIQQAGDLSSVTFENIYNAEASLLEERWDGILNLRTWKIKSPDSLPLVEVPYAYLARPAPSGQMMPDLLSGLQVSMTRRPQNTIGTVTCMEDMPHRYLLPCESREGGQETAVLTGDGLQSCCCSDVHEPMHGNTLEYTIVYGNNRFNKIYGRFQRQCTEKYNKKEASIKI